MKFGFYHGVSRLQTHTIVNVVIKNMQDET